MGLDFKCGLIIYFKLIYAQSKKRDEIGDEMKKKIVQNDATPVVLGRLRLGLTPAGRVSTTIPEHNYTRQQQQITRNKKIVLVRGHEKHFQIRSVSRQNSKKKCSTPPLPAKERGPDTVCDHHNNNNNNSNNNNTAAAGGRPGAPRRVAKVVPSATRPRGRNHRVRRASGLSCRLTDPTTILWWPRERRRL